MIDICSTSQFFVRTTRPLKVVLQSTPLNSASIRVASAVPKLPKLPRQPRGDSYSPCVLICAGGVFPGMIAVVPVIVIGSHEFSERTVARNVCRFVCGTTSNVHVVAPVVGAGAFASPGLG
jgi:hypothetical protein